MTLPALPVACPSRSPTGAECTGWRGHVGNHTNFFTREEWSAEGAPSCQHREWREDDEHFATGPECGKAATNRVCDEVGKVVCATHACRCKLPLVSVPRPQSDSEIGAMVREAINRVQREYPVGVPRAVLLEVDRVVAVNVAGVVGPGKMRVVLEWVAREVGRG